MARGPALTRFAATAIRLAVGAAFVYAGWLKSRDPGAFVRDIWNYHAVPEPWAYWIAAYLPHLEIVAGLALVTGLQRRGAHGILAALLAVFLGLLGWAWARGLDVDCGCFGAAGSGSGPAGAVIRDLLLLCGIAASAWADRRPRPADTAG
jgi:uncharacterized membrane protein YphA (DoxX/SURF4 family)